MSINKQEGVTDSEKLLSELCERTFLKLWSWPSPRKQDGKEICDVIAIFDDHVFIFFDRESKSIQRANKDIDITWERWKKEVIDKQVQTARGATRYVRDRKPIFIDRKCKKSLPIPIPNTPIIHRIVVAHGAKEACEQHSEDNIYGSLAISYGRSRLPFPTPFLVELERNDPVHVLDSVNLEIVLSELDTFHDFAAYICEKEEAIEKHDLTYCGEEDLLGHYFMNLDSARQRYRIGVDDPSLTGAMIPEGAWKTFIEEGYRDRREKENAPSYLWDEIIQRSYQFALDGRSGGASAFGANNALFEMSREPRMSRRTLSKNMLEAIDAFPATDSGIVYKTIYMQSDERSKMYVFLQMTCHGKPFDECREARRSLLEVACGVVRNRFDHLKTVVGIAIEPPKYSENNAEDFLLLKCATWSNESRAHYDDLNKHFGLFKKVTRIEQRISDFE